MFTNTNRFCKLGNNTHTQIEGYIHVQTIHNTDTTTLFTTLLPQFLKGIYHILGHIQEISQTPKDFQKSNILDQNPRNGKLGIGM